MKAFNDDLATKAALMRRLAAHGVAGDLVSPATHWDGEKGSVAGCLVHDTDFTVWESQTGLPKALAPIIDLVAGALAPTEAGAAFALYWLSIIRVGVDLDGLPADVIAYLVGDPVVGISRYADDARVQDAALLIVRLHKRAARGDRPTAAEWQAARAIAIEATDGCEGLSHQVGECIEASGWDVSAAPAVVNDVLTIWLRIMNSVGNKAFLDDPIHASVKAKLDELHPTYLKIVAGNPEKPLDFYEFVQQRAPAFHALLQYNPHINPVRDAVLSLTLDYCNDREASDHRASA